MCDLETDLPVIFIKFDMDVRKFNMRRSFTIIKLTT